MSDERTTSERLDDMYNQMENEFAADYGEDAYSDDNDSAGHSNGPTGSKKQTGLLIGILVAVAILIGVIVFLLFKMFYSNDKAKLGTAFARIIEDAQAERDAYMTTDQAEYLINQVAYGDMKAEYSMNVSGIPNVPVTVGVDGTTVRKFGDQKLSMDTTLSVMNADIASVSAYADGTDLYVKIPLFLSKTIKVDTEELATKLNNSYIAQMAGQTIPEGVDYRPFGDGEKKYIDLVSWDEILGNYDEELKAVGDEIEVNKDKEKETISLTDGTSVECAKYHVILTKDTVEPMLVYIMEFYLSNLKDNLDSTGYRASAEQYLPELAQMNTDDYHVALADNIQLLVLMDRDGNIRRIENEAPIEMNGTIIDMSMELRGAEVETDEIATSFSVIKPGNGNMTTECGSDVDAFMSAIAGNSCSMTKSRTDDGKLIVTAILGGEVSAVMSYMGSYTYDVQNDAYSTYIDGLDVMYNGEKVLNLSGGMSIETRDVSVSATPDEDAIDLLNMDMMDAITVISEFAQNYQNIMQIAETLGM